MTSGLTAFIASYPRFHFSSVPGRKFSSTTSTCGSNLRTISCPSGVRRSRVIDRLLRACKDQKREVLPRKRRHWRSSSPVLGRSTLMTSAPNSAKSRPAYGAAIKLPSSNTRKPLSGPFRVSMYLLRSAKLEGVARLAGKFDPDRLGMRVLAHALQTVFTTHAAHLVATKGRIERQRAVRVDPDGSRTQGVRHAVRPPDIARPDAGGQAITRLIRLPDDLFLRLERDHGEDRAENLFLGYAHLVVDLREDGRLNEKAMHQIRVGGNLPSSDQLSTFLLGNVDVTLDLFLLAFEGGRTHRCLYLQRVAQLDRTRTFGKPTDDFIMHLSFDKEPRACNTGLATGGEDPRNHSVDDSFIRVGEDNVGRLAA